MNIKLQSMNFKLIWISCLVTWVLPMLAWAHEVYVLPSESIESAMNAVSPNPFLAYFGNESEFILWGLVSLIALATIACATMFRLFESSLSPLLIPLKSLALPLVRIATGISVLSFGIAGAIFGTELPLQSMFGVFAPAVGWMFVVVGCLMTVGLYTREMSILMLLAFAFSASETGWYMLTYADHLGAYVALFILGSGPFSIDHARGRPHALRIPHLSTFVPYAFPALRILFGIGVIFASIYAKYIHSQLALDVVLIYDLTRFFPFDPLFVVLGALIIEFLAGLMLVLGIAIRWTNIFLLFWLTLSLLYFQEAIWPHVILFGLAAALFCHGYDRFSLEGLVLKRRGREPLL